MMQHAVTDKAPNYPGTPLLVRPSVPPLKGESIVIILLSMIAKFLRGVGYVKGGSVTHLKTS
eukprot:1158991-Pelagomonas_calceolata.AAC.1